MAPLGTDTEAGGGAAVPVLDMGTSRVGEVLDKPGLSLGGAYIRPTPSPVELERSGLGGGRVDVLLLLCSRRVGIWRTRETFEEEEEEEEEVMAILLLGIVCC